MLILTRKLGESITIGDDIRITVMSVKGNQVKIGIEAPLDLKVFREELYSSIAEDNHSSRMSDNSNGSSRQPVSPKSGSHRGP